MISLPERSIKPIVCELKDLVELCQIAILTSYLLFEWSEDMRNIR